MLHSACKGLIKAFYERFYRPEPQKSLPKSVVNLPLIRLADSNLHMNYIFIKISTYKYFSFHTQATKPKTPLYHFLLITLKFQKILRSLQVEIYPNSYLTYGF